MKLLLLVVLATACWSSTSPAPVSNAAVPTQQVTADSIPHAGNPTARVKIVSYFNYRCPHCIDFEPTLDQIVRKYGDTIVVHYRTLRLPVHPDADRATIAAFAAHRQGRFLDMHRVLFAGGAFDPDSLRGHAQKLGLDVERFVRDLDDPKLRARIDQDTADAEAADVAFVPYLTINGTQYEDVLDLGHLTTRIDAALAR